MEIKYFFSFERMVTPKIIMVIYWLLLLGVISGGISFMFGVFGQFTFGGFIRGLLIIVVGSLLVRIWCELMIIIFKINDNLQKIREHKEKGL